MLNIETATLEKCYKIKALNIKNQHMLQRLNALGLNDRTDVKIKQKCLFKGLVF